MHLANKVESPLRASLLFYFFIFLLSFPIAPRCWVVSRNLCLPAVHGPSYASSRTYWQGPRGAIGREGEEAAAAAEGAGV